MEQDIILYRWQIRIMMSVALKQGIVVAQAMHNFIWGTPEGPALAMTQTGPVISKGFM
jgi:hypothetical protein